MILIISFHDGSIQEYYANGEVCKKISAYRRAFDVLFSRQNVRINAAFKSLHKYESSLTADIFVCLKMNDDAGQMFFGYITSQSGR